MEVARRMFMEAHVLVEADGRILAIHIQFDSERPRMDRFQVSYSLFDDKTPDSLSLIHI